MDVFDLYAKISLDSTAYEKGVKNIQASASNIKGKIGDAFATMAKVAAAAMAATTAATVGLTKALVSGANEIADYGDNIDKMSQKMGMSAQAYQEWDAVLQHSGTSIETMKASMKTLANAAQSNNKAFKELGITEKDLKNLNQEQLFAKTIEQLQKVDNTTQRTYLAGQLLGRGATELGALLNTSAEDTQKMKDRVHQLGGVMSDEAVKASAKFKDNLQDLKTAFGGLKRGIISDTLPAFNDLMDGFTKLMAGEEDAEKTIDKGISKLEKAISNIAPKIKKLTETLLPRVLKVAATLISELAKSAPKLIAEIAPVLFNAGAEIVTNIGKGIFETLENTDLEGGAKTLTEKVNGMIENVDTAKGGQRFADVLNKIIGAAFNVTSTFNFSGLATKLTDFLNNALNNVNWNKLGQTVSNAWKGVWDFIGTALNNIDWKGVGNAISEFINNVDWWGILDSMFKVIGEVISKMPELLWGALKNLDFNQAAGMFAVWMAPKMASKLLTQFQTDAATKTTLTQAGEQVGSTVNGGALAKAGEMAGGIVGTLSKGIQVAGILATAYGVGYQIGTWIRQGLEAINILEPIENAIEWWLDNSLVGGWLTGDIAAQGEESDKRQAQSMKETAQKLKDKGAWWLSGTGSDSLDAIKKAGNILSEYEKYKYQGVTINDVLYGTGNYTSAVSRSQAYQDVSSAQLGVPTSVLNQQTQIYLDTGKLVGGTGNTRAQQTNYTARGYAT